MTRDHSALGAELDHMAVNGIKFGELEFGSVCSGISASSVAWKELGWKACWFSEVEPFPSSLLAHRFPYAPNLGDMRSLPDRIRSGEVPAPELFCGGTPCQAFSVAGLRNSLDDERGNLTLTFCEISNEIDTARAAQDKPPAILFWENVTGVLNTKDNAFGCFLAGLAGEDDALEPSGGRWSDAGVVFGPQRAVAWRILDAKYFGLAQRRRRVFVVSSARDGFDPAAVLFEFEGTRRDRAPGWEAERPLHPTLTAKGGGALDDREAYVLEPEGVRRTTVTEWERCQGFPDGHTDVPHRGKQAADGPRMKAIGNSWAVPVAAWIGYRIKSQLIALQIRSLEESVRAMLLAA